MKVHRAVEEGVLHAQPGCGNREGIAVTLAQDNADRTGAIATPRWELGHSQAEHNIGLISLETWGTFLREEARNHSVHLLESQGLEGGMRGWAWAGAGWAGNGFGESSVSCCLPPSAPCPLPDTGRWEPGFLEDREGGSPGAQGEWWWSTPETADIPGNAHGEHRGFLPTRFGTQANSTRHYAQARPLRLLYGQDPKTMTWGTPKGGPTRSPFR